MHSQITPVFILSNAVIQLTNANGISNFVIMLKMYHMEKFLFRRKRNPIAKLRVGQFCNVLKNFLCLQTCQDIFKFSLR